MPANGRWDLIRRLKVKSNVRLIIETLTDAQNINITSPLCPRHINFSQAEYEPEQSVTISRVLLTDF